ncbi:hypothetical protein F4802DRAFT_597665 [Xylaria palmicola]|nr:hypothetical protein F4802DRAFT_597665 [Xylaria palmicola]
MEPIRIRVRTPVPRGATRELAARDLGPRVLDGCCVEAERADRVGFCLQGLRNSLPEHLHPHLTAVIDQLQITSRLLRDLADKSQIHLSQVPVMIDYLNVILPCLCRTLRDIMGYYEDKFMSKEHRWRTMYHVMSNELPGTTLPARFVMYNQFLGLLNFMLTRDPNFDVNAMEALRIRILQLRDARKIALSEQTSSGETLHWTSGGKRQTLIGPKPYLRNPYHPAENLEEGADELAIERESSSVLFLTYWNPIERRKKAWASLSFLTWEELVLFYCTFVCLKARNEWAHSVDVREFILRREKRLFQAQIIDDGFDHCLIVIEDHHTKGRRLHVVARDGPLARCPVWTAFAPPAPSEDWIIHKAPHRVWLRDLQVYSFCDEYHPHTQRRGRCGAFQIKFAHAAAAARFKQLFNPIPDPSVEDASEEHDEDDFTPSDD